MKRVFGQIGRLGRDRVDEYCRLHEKDVHTPRWAGVLETIRLCNMRNYSIFIEDDLVFGYFEYVGEDYDADMARMAADPVTQDWWSRTRPCFARLRPDSPEAFYSDMRRIFHFDPEEGTGDPKGAGAPGEEAR